MALPVWARARLSLGSAGRFGVAYFALAAAIRVVLTAHMLQDIYAKGFGDVGFYYQMVGLSDLGQYPFIHFWMEYPPVFPLAATGLYRVLALAGPVSLQSFVVAFTVALLTVELVNLVLVYLLVRRAYDERAARLAAAIYAGCPALVWISAGWFDPLAVLFFLAALYALTCKRPATSGALIAIGVLIKVYPGVLLVAAPAAVGWVGTRRLVLAMVAALAALLAPFLATRPDLLVASFASMATRGPWETVPAILSGYFAWGTQPPLADRVSAASGFLGSDTPALLTLLPELVVLLAVAGGALAVRFRRSAPSDLYAVAALAVITFALGNKGFSPQFVSWLIPVVLLVWPNRTGLIYVALLSVHVAAYIQYVNPPMYALFNDGIGSIDQVARLVSASVVLRTLLVAWIAGHLWVMLARPLRRPRSAVPSLPRFAFFGFTYTRETAVK